MNEGSLTVIDPISECISLADLSRTERERQENPSPVQGEDGMWKFLDQKDTVFWYAVFYTEEDARAAWAVAHPGVD